MEKEKAFIPVMLTPFNEEGSIDFNGLTILTEYYLSNGAKGLFANCQSSEMFELSPEERLQLIKHVIKTVNGRVPVVATGNFGTSIEEQATFVKQVYALGVQAVILLTNQFVEESEDEFVLEANILKLLALTENIPVGFYECPVPYKIVFTPGLLGRLVTTGRVKYHKDTSLNLAQVQEKNGLCKNIPGFGLYDAYMAHAVASLKSGSAGLSCIQGNYFPELVVWLCKNYNNELLKKEVQYVQHFFIEEMDVMHKNYPQSAKYYLQLIGLPVTTYTRSLNSCKIDNEIKEDMKELKKRYDNLISKLKVYEIRYDNIV